MIDITVTVRTDDHSYTFRTADIRRNITDGAGNPIYHVLADDEAGIHAAVNLNPDWTVRSLYRFAAPDFCFVKEV